MKCFITLLFASVALTPVVIHATPMHSENQSTPSGNDATADANCQPIPRHLSTSPGVANRPGSIPDKLLFESQGLIYRCLEDGITFVKKVTREKEDIPSFYREYVLHKRAHDACPESVARPYDYVADANSASFKMDYARGGDIFELSADLVNIHPAPVAALRSAFHDMALAIRCVKTLNVIHADIKTDNFVIGLPNEYTTKPPAAEMVQLLIEKKARVLLVDFGASFHTKEYDLVDTFWGTHAFMAREIYHRHYISATDRHLSEVASLGMTFLYTVYAPPADFATPADVMRYRSRHPDIPVLSAVNRRSTISVSDSLYSLLTDMTQVDLDERLTIEKVLDHGFFKEGIVAQK